MSIEDVKKQVQEEADKAKGSLNDISSYVMEELLTCQENADKIAKKTLKDAMQHVESLAKKQMVKRDSSYGVAMIHPNEVYGWIREFYEISDLTVVKAKPEAKPSVSLFDLL